MMEIHHETGLPRTRTTGVDVTTKTDAWRNALEGGADALIESPEAAIRVIYASLLAAGIDMSETGLGRSAKDLWNGSPGAHKRFDFKSLRRWICVSAGYCCGRALAFVRTAHKTMNATLPFRGVLCRIVGCVTSDVG